MTRAALARLTGQPEHPTFGVGVAYGLVLGLVLGIVSTGFFWAGRLDRDLDNERRTATAEAITPESASTLPGAK